MWSRRWSAATAAICVPCSAVTSLVVPYLLMLLVLLVRPYGLFGTREVERI